MFVALLSFASVIFTSSTMGGATGGTQHYYEVPSSYNDEPYLSLALYDSTQFNMGGLQFGTLMKYRVDLNFDIDDTNYYFWLEFYWNQTDYYIHCTTHTFSDDTFNIYFDSFNVYASTGSPNVDHNNYTRKDSNNNVSVYLNGDSNDYIISEGAFYYNNWSTGFWTLDFHAKLLPSNYGASGDYDLGYSQGYNNGSRVGYDKGYDAGESAGSQQGYTQGYTAGYTQGETDGYNEGFDDASGSNYTFFSLFGAIADTPIMFLRQLLGFEVFGVQAISILMSMLTGCIVLYLVRKIIL